ncbi:prominin-1-A-like isoform X1 [Mya arenaria]|uniref:prominin-1-A-like isoform X1 n=1 Tax=Mya arenaria TaxID=6604 RepID=UPI0022E8FB18|nr:prominin-1-A-like isoform X1 [Mya arenaria]
MMYRLIWVLIFTLVVNCYGQNNDTGTGVSNGPDAVTDGTDEKTALQKGMEGVFTLNHNFLDTVMSSNFYEESDKFSVQDLIRVVNQTDFGYLQNHWRDIVATFGGYAGCIIMGQIFLIFMPIVGCLYCCCHCCCHKCGGTREPKDPAHASCKRWTLFFLLFTCATMVLAGCIILFLGGELLHRSLSNEDNTSMLGRIDSSLIKVDQFVNQTIVEVRQEIKNEVVNKGIVKIKPEIQGAAQRAVDNIEGVINASSLLKEADTLGQDAKNALTQLEQLDKSLSKLKSLQINISTELRDISAAINQTCPPGQCQGINASVLTFNPDFSALNNLQNKASQVRQANNITDLVKEAKKEFIKTKEHLDGDIAKELNSTDATVNNLNKTVHDQLKKLDDLTKPLSDALTNAHNDIEDLKPTFQDIGKYIWYSCVGMGCVVLLVVVFYYMGLLFGWCGERPSHNANCCNRGTAANLLCTGICCSFLFCWLLMLIVILLFSTGGLTYSLFCKYVGNGLENVNVFENVLRDGFNFNINQGFEGMQNLSLSGIFEKCKNNKAIYEAVNLKYILDIDDVVNISDIVQDVNKIKNQNLSLPDITLLSNDLKTQLEKFRNAQLENVDYSEYQVELDKPLLKEVDLPKLIEKLRNASIVFSKPDLSDSANQLKSLQDKELAAVKNETVKLKSSIQELQRQNGSSVDQLISQINASQNSYNTNKTTIAKEQLGNAVVAIVDIVNGTFETVKDFVKYEMGKCRPLYDDASQLVDAVCLYTVDPLNAIWFGLGWCLFFYIPCFIFAAILAGLYKRQEPYEKDMPFDEIQQPYNGYARNDEQMQLTSMDGNKGGNRNSGVHNNGYQGREPSHDSRYYREDYNSPSRDPYARGNEYAQPHAPSARPDLPPRYPGNGYNSESMGGDKAPY